MWWIVPRQCLLCQAWTGQHLCPACHNRHAPLPPNVLRCSGCGLRVPPGVSRCSECQRHPPQQQATLVAVDYEFPWDRVLQQLKFGHRPEVARALGGLMVRALSGADPPPGRPDLVLPVPLSPERLGQRGYNQAWEIARHAARALRVPAHPGVLQRSVHLSGQALEDRASRLQRLQGVFHIPARQRSRVAGRTVALVDDVLTTGATVAQAVAALQAAGARSVWVWALARTPAPLEGAS